MGTISYATLGFQDRSVEAALDRIAEAGFPQAELLGQAPHVAEPPQGAALTRFRNHLESLGLSATVHAPLQKNVLGAPDEEWRRERVGVLAGYLAFAGEIGAREIVIHPVPNPCFVPHPDDPAHPARMREAARRSLEDLLPLALRSGVRILLENLPYACPYPLMTMRELRGFVDAYPPEGVGLVVDTGHAAVLGLDPADEIRLAGDRLWGTHLHDMDVQGRQDDHWLPTQGGLDWASIRRALGEVNYRGAWTFEVQNARHGETPEELARVARQIAARWGVDEPKPGRDGTGCSWQYQRGAEEA